MDSEAVKDKAVESSKRPREELEFDKSKKQKLDENVQAEVADDDTAELKRYIEDLEVLRSIVKTRFEKTKL
nr:hypothetical protein [Tanacetum cinerariifolium]